ncbi:MAG: sigma-70 family RNA polymerase sigma factor [Planctomycetota bacterium]
MDRTDPPDIETLLADREWLDGLARTIAGPGAVAEDAVQDTWLTALENGPPHSGNRRGWLGTVLRNALRKSHRSATRRADRERDWASDRPQVTSADEAESLFALRHDLANAVMELDEGSRRVILLRFVHELPLREVAARLGIPLSTADGRIRRALRKLRARLDRDPSFDRRVVALLGLPLRPPKASAAHSIGWWTAAAAAGLAAIVAFGTTVPDKPGGAHSEPAPSMEPIAGAASSEGLGPRVAAKADPSNAASSAGSTGTLIVEVVRADGAPVPGVHVRPRPVHDASRPRGVRTNAAGRATFEGLAPGTVEIVSDRLRARRRDIVVGRTIVERCVAPMGRLSGEVVDPAGRPVPDAVIWLAPTAAGWLFDGAWVVASVDESEAARSDARGRFSIDVVGEAELLFSRAAGYERSAPLRLARVTDRDDVRVRLPGAGGVLAGCVTDASGAPAASAEVTLDPPSNVDRPTPRRTTLTDGDGRFRFSGAALGERRLHVDAAGDSTRLVEAAVPDDDLRIELGPGRRLSGRVLTVDGGAASNVEVVATWGDRGSSRAAVTDEEGTFALGGLPRSPLQLRAQERAADGAAARVQIDEAHEASVVLQLAPYNRLRGSVRDAAGHPLSSCVVLVERSFGRPWTRARTAGDGGFDVSVLGHQDRRILVSEHGTTVFDGIARSEEVVAIVVPDSARPRSRLVGRAIEPGGTPSDAMRLELREQDSKGSRVLRIEARDGRFRTRPLPAGSFEVRLVGALGEATIRGVELMADAELDLGTIDLVPTVTVELDFSGPLEHFAFELFDAGGARRDRRSIVDGEVELPLRYQLVEGMYRVDVRSARAVPQSFEFAVGPASPSHLHFNLQSGVPQLVVARPRRDAPAMEELHVVLERGGTTVLDTLLTPNWFRPDGAFVLRVGLDPGRYSLSAELRDESAQRVFVVEPARSRALEVTLR